MKLGANAALRVRLRWGPGREQVVGRLAWRARRAWFEYTPEFLASGLQISPFKLPLGSTAIEAPPSFGGLFGVFDDSLPDGWGRLLQDRLARRRGLSPASLTPLDRLAWVGAQGIGALAYEPEFRQTADDRPLELDRLAREASEVLAGSADEALAELQRLGGSPHGARPKILVGLRPSDGGVQPEAGDGHRPAMVKFLAAGDGDDAGAVEFAYHRMARQAGIEVPEAWLLDSQAGPGWFAVARFDLQGEERVHVHTLSGLLHADHRLPSLDYQSVLAATHRLTGDQRAVEQMYLRMVFNVMAHNRDDHSKQFSLMMDAQGQWALTPAYDLTFSEGPGGEHSTSVCGEGRPGLPALLRAARAAGIGARRADELIEQVRESLSGWPEHARAAGVGGARLREIQGRFRG